MNGTGARGVRATIALAGALCCVLLALAASASADAPLNAAAAGDTAATVVGAAPAVAQSTISSTESAVATTSDAGSAPAAATVPAVHVPLPTQNASPRLQLPANRLPGSPVTHARAGTTSSASRGSGETVVDPAARTGVPLAARRAVGESASTLSRDAGRIGQAASPALPGGRGGAATQAQRPLAELSQAATAALRPMARALDRAASTFAQTLAGLPGAADALLSASGAREGAVLDPGMLDASLPVGPTLAYTPTAIAASAPARRLPGAPVTPGAGAIGSSGPACASTGCAGAANGSGRAAAWAGSPPARAGASSEVAAATRSAMVQGAGAGGPTAIGAAAGGGVSISILVLGLLLVWAPWTVRRLRLASESLCLAPYHLIPERPG